MTSTHPPAGAEGDVSCLKDGEQFARLFTQDDSIWSCDDGNS